MKRYAAVPIMIVLFAPWVTRAATLFKWTDDQGVVHFTDDRKKVPDRYLNRVRTDVIEERAPAPAAPPEHAAPSAGPEGAPGGALPADYGGHTGEWWRNRFATVRDGIKSLQEGLVVKQDRLKELHRQRVIYQRARDRVAENALSDEMANDEARIKELEADLAALAQDADRAGVPNDWR